MNVSSWCLTTSIGCACCPAGPQLYESRTSPPGWWRYPYIQHASVCVSVSVSSPSARHPTSRPRCRCSRLARRRRRENLTVHAQHLHLRSVRRYQTGTQSPPPRYACPFKRAVLPCAECITGILRHPRRRRHCSIHSSGRPEVVVLQDAHSPLTSHCLLTTLTDQASAHLVALGTWRTDATRLLLRLL